MSLGRASLQDKQTVTPFFAGCLSFVLGGVVTRETAYVYAKKERKVPSFVSSNFSKFSFSSLVVCMYQIILMTSFRHFK